MTDLSSDFIEDCIRWRGRVLNGDYAHWCPDWDGLPIDETCNEWPCNCGYKEWKDDTDAQPIPALKDAQERTKGMLTEADHNEPALTLDIDEYGIWLIEEAPHGEKIVTTKQLGHVSWKQVAAYIQKPLAELTGGNDD